MAPTGNVISFALLAVVLVLAGVLDWRTGKVPNWLTYPAILAGFALAMVLGLLQLPPHQGGLWDGLSATLLAFLAGLLPMWVIFACGGMGGGDVKLVAAVGAITASIPCLLATAFYGFLIGALMAIYVMFRRRIFWRTVSRLLNAAFSLAGGSPDLDTTDSPRLPFGAAVKIGGLLAGMEHLLRLQLPWHRVFP